MPRALFFDRRDAGFKLGSALQDAFDASALVLGLALGGVVVAASVARRLQTDLDVLVVRKLGAPQSEELAIGAVTTDGGLYLNEEIIRWLEVRPEYIESEIERQRALGRERETRYRRGHRMPDLEDRVVILVDDGLATGASMIAAINSVRKHQPATVVVAVPVGAPGSCGDLKGLADDVVCLHQPDPFWSVGAFYRDFSEVLDEEVEDALQEVAARVPRAA